MASPLIDPPDHAPPGSPDDTCGDPIEPSQNTPIRLLPPKKQPLTAATTGRNRAGLRIDANPQRQQSERPLDVRSINGSVVRLTPEIPTAPKVARRMTHPTAPDPRRGWQGEGSQWGLAHKSSMRWIIGSGVGVVTVVVAALFLLPMINRSSAAHPRLGKQPTQKLVLEQEDQPLDMAPMNNLTLRQAEAVQLYRGYVSAAIIEDILPLVRDSATVEPLIRAKRRPTAISKAWQPATTSTWSVIENEGHPFGLLEGTLPDFTTFSAYCVVIDRQLQLDWKATTGYGTATFSEMAHNQGDTREIRAIVMTNLFYTATYPEAEYHSYQLVSPDGRQAIWGYTRRGETADQRLGKLFWSGEILNGSEAQQKLTLRLDHGLAGSLPNQWMITQLLHKEWITP